MIYEVIIIYLIVILIYFKVHGVSKNKFEKLVFSICVPIFGFIITVFSEMIEKQTEVINIKTNIRKNKIERSKEFLTYIQSSIVDNLRIEDYQKAREIILSMQSLPLKKQCEICHISIWSNNTEISHISAVSLMRIKTSFEKFLTHMESYADLSKLENVKRYIDGLENYLECNLVYGTLKNRYIEKVISLTKEYIEKSEECDEKYYHILINRCMQIGNYATATEYINLLLEKYETTEETYEFIIKLCVETKDRKRLEEVLDEIKNRQNITTKMQNILEFWEGAIV